MNSNSAGKFREGIIDGKQFLIFTLLSQTDSLSCSSSGEAAAIEFGGNDLTSQPLFICPSMRANTSRDSSFAPVDVPPQFPRSDHQQPEYMLHSNSCKLPLLLLFWCNNKEPDGKDFTCRACYETEHSTSYYFCVSCGDKFHKECLVSPLEFKHPSYPSLLLQLYSRPKVTTVYQMFYCYCCDIPINTMSYYCPTKNFRLGLLCAFKPIAIIIDNLKRHPHPLTFFPKQAFLPCSVCGLVIEIIPTYVCLRCVFVVHEKCIYSPYVIRISRHHHRISFISSLPSGKLSCGVCRKKVDNDYGAYSCNTSDDGYFVHSRYALRKDLWDGKELEGIPEEPEIVVEPFKRIADGVILHFSHGHHLKLEMSLAYDQHKLCQACVLPIYDGSYYSCLDGCDFIFA